MSGKKGDGSLINLGAAPFLNMRPLIYPLEKGVVEHSFNIMYLTPSLFLRICRKEWWMSRPFPRLNF